MPILLTGAAGFVGYHVATALLARGEDVIGIDNVNAYYPPKLKRARLDLLSEEKGFRFVEADIADRDAMAGVVAGEKIKTVVHLAAQAGVRYSLEAPMEYINSNVVGHTVILELCRHMDSFEHLVYASSSSVYGKSTTPPFKETARADWPVSLYAATKRSGEMISISYTDLYGLRQTGLRFFTVYGPWGRPDMAYWKFTEAIFKGEPIPVFNNGDMKRDFSYIDDIVKGVLGTMDNPPKGDTPQERHRLFNIGAKRPEDLMHFIEVIEHTVGKKARLDMKPMQAGDVYETSADTTALEQICDFSSSVPIEEGIPRFVNWFKSYHHL